MLQLIILVHVSENEGDFAQRFHRKIFYHSYSPRLARRLCQARRLEIMKLLLFPLVHFDIFFLVCTAYICFLFACLFTGA